jgi:hypothetical protein
MTGSGKGVRPNDIEDLTGGVSHHEPPPAERWISVPDSPVVRARSIALVGAGTLLSLGVLATSCGDDGPGDTARFCAEVQEHTAELTTRPATLDDVDGFVELYRRIGRVAPLAIEPHWQALTLNYETASAVDTSDPESMENARAQAYATEESAVAVRDFLLSRCNVDIGPVATIVPQPAPPPPTTVAG